MSQRAPTPTNPAAVTGGGGGTQTHVRINTPLINEQEQSSHERVVTAVHAIVEEESKLSYPIGSANSPITVGHDSEHQTPIFAPQSLSPVITSLSSPASTTASSTSSTTPPTTKDDTTVPTIDSSTNMSIQQSSPRKSRNPANEIQRIASPPHEMEWTDNSSTNTTTATCSKESNAPSTKTPNVTIATAKNAAPASSVSTSASNSPLPVSSPSLSGMGSSSTGSSTSSRIAATAANKRKTMVAQFIRSGETNMVFREKAPSIVPNETGVFYAPPTAMSAARAAAIQREEREREHNVERSGIMPIPLTGLNLIGGRNDSGRQTPSSATSSSPRRYSTLGSPAMGISSRQLMFQLSSSANTAAAANVAAASQAQLGKREHRRGSSGVPGTNSAFAGPTFARSDSRNSISSDDELSHSLTPRHTKRFSIFGGSNANKEDKASMLRANSASPASMRKSPLTRPLLPTPLPSRSARATATGRSARAGGGGVLGSKKHEPSVDEEERRKEEEREANMLAPFLEARGNEDFVTYDLTRQQDYHKQRKELTRERFRRWTRDIKKKKVRSIKDKEVELEDDTLAKSLTSNGDQKNDDKAHPIADKPNHSSSDSEDDGEGGDGGGGSGDDDPDDDDPDATPCQRRIRRCVSIPFIRAIVRACMLGQSWFICGLIGAITGLLAAVVDLAAQWIIDLKSGYCSDALYLSNSFCCAGSPQWIGGTNSQPLLLMCPQWKNWDSNSAISSLSSSVSPFFAAYLMYVTLGVTMACISAWLVLYFAPHAAGSGIPEIKTILGGVVVKKYLGGWTLLIKITALILSVGSGLSLGKEGGYVHVSCCVANILCRYFPEFKNNQYKKNEAISAASAAGISVAFGAPVGGVLFSLEEVASYFPHKTMWRAFFCAIIASIVFQSIDPYQEGRLVLFQMNYNKPWYWFEMGPFIAIGIMGGLGGALFIHLNNRIALFRKESIIRQYPIFEVACVALVTVVIKYLSAFLRGNNNSVLASLLGDCKAAPYYDPLEMCDESGTLETIGALIFTCVVTFIFTNFTWSLCVPGGVFVPALIIGASFGRMVGTIMRAWQSSSYAISLFDGCEEFTPGIYALVGAASMLGGVTRMTVCLVVIMFEITGGLAYLLPIMVGLMFSKLVGDAFDRRSIFEAHLILNKYPFLNSKDRISPKIRVSDAMSRDLLALPMHGHTVESLTDQLALLAELRITGFPIVTTLKDRFIVGYMNRSELYTALCLALRNPSITPQTRCYFAMLSLRFPRNDPYVDLRPWLHPSPIQVVEHTPLYRVHDMFKKMGLRYVLVTNFGKLVGILTKKDILNAIERQSEKEKAQENKKLQDNQINSNMSGTVNDYHKDSLNQPLLNNRFG